eukprot:TRINITY_DN37006_c1_g1_i1.p1 TRINITY_DN37006_c1_g1~~TRINITY_DN37006_c1_g1_i1.p1  ORF type:complete len:239 (-),score=58.57 TRINITY_DN37006_c1_g1_i1:183-899(-)
MAHASAARTSRRPGGLLAEERQGSRRRWPSLGRSSTRHRDAAAAGQTPSATTDFLESDQALALRLQAEELGESAPPTLQHAGDRHQGLNQRLPPPPMPPPASTATVHRSSSSSSLGRTRGSSQQTPFPQQDQQQQQQPQQQQQQQQTQQQPQQQQQRQHQPESDYFQNQDWGQRGYSAQQCSGAWQNGRAKSGHSTGADYSDMGWASMGWMGSPYEQWHGHGSYDPAGYGVYENYEEM